MSEFSRLYQAYADQFDEDLLLWRSLAHAAGAPILELGCGNGRVLRHLQQLGYPSVGVDLDMAALAAAAGDSDRPSLVAADMRRLPFAPNFRLAIAPSHTAAYFPEGDLAQVLRGLAHCVLPYGQIALDLPAPASMSGASGEVLDSFEDPKTGRHIQLSAVEHAPLPGDPVVVEWHLDEMLPDGRVIRHSQERRYFIRSLQALRRLIGAAGFDSIRFSGDYQQRPYVETDTTLVVTARRSESAARPTPSA